MASPLERPKGIVAPLAAGAAGNGGDRLHGGALGRRPDTPGSPSSVSLREHARGGRASTPGQSRRPSQPTARDVAALRDLTRFGVLAAGHLGQWHYPGPGAAAARLAALVRAGYVLSVRPRYRGRAVYLATPAGARLAGMGLRAARLRPALVPHQLGVADLAAALLPLYPGARWIAERELAREAARARRLPQQAGPTGRHHLPDGAVALGGVRVAVELELTPKKPEGYRRILGWYGTARYARVVWFCAAPSLRRRLARLIAEEQLEDVATAQPLPAGVDAGDWG